MALDILTDIKRKPGLDAVERRDGRGLRGVALRHERALVLLIAHGLGHKDVQTSSLALREKCLAIRSHIGSEVFKFSAVKHRSRLSACRRAHCEAPVRQPRLQCPRLPR